MRKHFTAVPVLGRPRTLLKLTHLILTGGAIALRAALGSAELEDRSFQGLLVLQPCRTLRFERPLQLGVLLLDAGKLLENGVKPGCQRIDIGLTQGQPVKIAGPFGAYLALSQLSFRGRLVLIVGSSQGLQSCLVSLADLLELLYMAPCGGEVDFSYLQRRSRSMISHCSHIEDATLLAPQLRNLSFKLLLAAEIVAGLRGRHRSTRCSPLIHGELLLVTPKLSVKLFDPLLEVLLASLSRNKSFTRLGVVLVL